MDLHKERKNTEEEISEEKIKKNKTLVFLYSEVT